MIVPLVVRRLAERDLAHARDWYDAQVKGLGGDFLSAVQISFLQIRELP